MSLDPFFHFKNKIDRVIRACSIFYLKGRSLSTLAHTFLITSFYCLNTYSDHVLCSGFPTSWCLSLHELPMY